MSQPARAITPRSARAKARATAREVRRYRRLGPPVAAPPVPPPFLYPGHVLALPGRGETFVRHHRPEPGAPAVGPTVLLLHGWTASADLQWFTAYTALAAEGYEVVAVDHRGHGRGIRSEETFTLEDAADDAAAVVEQLGLGRVHAVGYSMGGPISLHLAHRHPDLVAGLTLCATALEWRATFAERARWRSLALSGPVFRSPRVHRMLWRALAALGEDVPDIGPHVPWASAEMRRSDSHALIQAGWALSRYDASPWAGTLGVPASVLLTTKDRLVPPRKQRQLARTVRADVVEADGDHLITLQRPKEFAEALVQAIGIVSRQLTG